MTLYCPIFFFFNDTATTEIYTLSLHDALPIYPVARRRPDEGVQEDLDAGFHAQLIERTLHRLGIDRKSTRLNSSHQIISYAVFCLKKKITKLVSNQSR